ncbi:post-GPI attachment to proteins factor 4-like [Liolophura sinensis]|uniref:post-GPI attachment to proteins factor 4-like n=1 Tax=Liolophura sinensis TaxID=3198878 RepID=UPI0031582ED4
MRLLRPCVWCWTDRPCQLIQALKRDRQCQQILKHLLVLYLVTFLLILPVLCFKLRFSVYHIRPRPEEAEKNYMKAENNERVKQAVKTIEAHRASLTHAPEDSSAVDVAITIITLSRNRHKFGSFEPKYLSQAVSSYLQLLHTPEAQEKHYKLYICGVDTEPHTYYEYKNLTRFLPSFQRFADHGKRVSVPDVFTKEKDDYVYCLNQTLQTGAKNVLLVEDDALPLADLFLVLNHVMDTHLHTLHREVNQGDQQAPAFIKLYHPDRLLGYWSPEVDRIPQLLAFGCLWGSLLCVLYGRKYSSSSSCLWAMFCLYFMLVAMAIGRQNLLEWRRLSKHFYLYTRTASCCTPAILYPKVGAEKVVRFLAGKTSHRDFPKDMALDEFRGKTGSSAYMIQPNLFRHIGLISSLRSTVLNPFAV